jgi:hypothetical protein
MWKRLTGLLALLLASSVPAGAVTVEAVATDYDFTTDGMLDVEFRVGDAGGLTGLEFSIVYPGELLAVDDPSSHALGRMFSHGFVNHEADASDLPAGSKRISVAFAVAQPVTATEGLLLTVSFPLRCSDFSIEWPEGRPVTIELEDAMAWTASGSEVPAPAQIQAQGTTITVDCITVSASSLGLSTLKFRHVNKGVPR